VNMCLGRAKSEQGCTVTALVGFIGAEAGVGAGPSVARAGPSVVTCSGIARAYRTHGRFILPEF
jgi:L-asparagine transporter-like permease